MEKRGHHYWVERHLDQSHERHKAEAISGSSFVGTPKIQEKMEEEVIKDLNEEHLRFVI